MDTFFRLFFFLSFGASDSSASSSMGSGSAWLGSPADSLDPTSICFFLRCLALSSVGGGVSVMLEAAAAWSEEPLFFLRGALSRGSDAGSCPSTRDASDTQHGRGAVDTCAAWIL